MDKDSGKLDIPFGEAPERIIIDTNRISDNMIGDDLVAVKAAMEMPRAWLELIQAIALMSKHQVNDVSPFHCEHNVLYVGAYDDRFTNEEIQQLEKWGFHRDSDFGGFYSYKYGSA